MTDKVLSIEERRSKYAVPALEKALDIIEYLSDQAVPMTQAQLSRALGRQPGELFRMLTALETRGYLRRDAVTGGYALTLKLFELSRTHSPYEELLRAATPIMRQLAASLDLSKARRDCASGTRKSLFSPPNAMRLPGFVVFFLFPRCMTDNSSFFCPQHIKKLNHPERGMYGGGAHKLTRMTVRGVCCNRGSATPSFHSSSNNGRLAHTFVTDNGNHILDCRIEPIKDPMRFELDIRAIPGVVGTGLFLGMADVVLVGEQGSFELIEEKRRSR